MGLTVTVHRGPRDERPARGPVWSHQAKRTGTRILLACGAVLTLVFGTPLAAHADSPTPPTTSPAQKPIVTFGIQPSTAIAPDGRGYFSLGATPGGELSDHVAVTNYSTQPLTLTLHTTGAVNTPEGDFALLPPTTRSNFAGWLQLPTAQSTLVLAARTTIIIPFKLVVPNTATPGDHAGGILVTLASSVISPSGQRLKLLQSSGVRMFVRVSGALHPKLSVIGLKAKYQGTANPVGKGKVTLTYSVRNDGNVGLGGQQTVWVSGFFGSKTYSTKLPRVQLLLPGFSVQQRVVIPGVFPELIMTGHVKISPLVIPGSIQPPSGPFFGTVHFWAIPWVLLAIVVVVIAFIAYLLARRRLGHQRRPSSPEAPKGPTGPLRWEEQPVTAGDQGISETTTAEVSQ